MLTLIIRIIIAYASLQVGFASVIILDRGAPLYPYILYLLLAAWGIWFAFHPRKPK